MGMNLNPSAVTSGECTTETRGGYVVDVGPELHHIYIKHPTSGQLARVVPRLLFTDEGESRELARITAREESQGGRI